MTRPLKPGMLVRRVINDQFDHHLKTTLVRRSQERFEIIKRSITRMNCHVIRDVIAIIAQGGRKKRQQPQTSHAQVLQIVKLLYQAGKIADAIVVAVGKSLHMQFVNDRIFVPEGIARTTGTF